jgi:dienelactone hydrolase
MRLRLLPFALAAFAIAAGGANAGLAAPELVRFESAAYRVGRIQQQQARERGEPARPGPDTISGYLSKPDGDGPFPAVIYLHGCAGLSASNRNRVSDLMTGWGYVSLAVDSFTTRGIKESCNEWRAPRIADALGGLLYASKLPYVDPKRIAVVGSSQGGIAVMGLASVHSVNIYAIPDDLTFRAAVAFYPACGGASQRAAIPTIILIGGLDDWTPAENCERWMRLRAGRGAPVQLTVYPGAYHAFDIPTLKDGRRYFGHWLAYDADAAHRANAAMHDFLARQLAK